MNSRKEVLDSIQRFDNETEFSKSFKQFIE